MAIGHWLKNFTKWYFDPGAEPGGGGGSSDLSTATVTVNYNFQEQEQLPDLTFIGLDGNAWNDENQEMTAIFKIDDKWNVSGSYMVPSPTGSYDREVLFLYENNKHCTMQCDALPVTFSVTGNASVVEGEYGQLVDITGDCTITIS